MAHACRFIVVIALCLAPTLARGAGSRFIDVPAGADGPAIHGALWYPCARPPAEIDLGRITLPGVRGCPLAGKGLPLIMVSHGRTSSFVMHHDADEVLADAGFDLAIMVERPTDIRRAIVFLRPDHLTNRAIARDQHRSAADRAERQGLYGTSRLKRVA
ncbi:hypothetical protein [Bradyrhizobium sp.]|uniref:hypothetical protein n=1 Tax=Bradyrhizobium sp. TaxID=376 RepID=UPI003C35B5F9